MRSLHPRVSRLKITKWPTYIIICVLFADIKFRHKIKKTGESFKSGRFRLPRGRTGDGCQKREPPAETGRLNRSVAVPNSMQSQQQRCAQKQLCLRYPQIGRNMVNPPNTKNPIQCCWHRLKVTMRRSDKYPNV